MNENKRLMQLFAVLIFDTMAREAEGLAYLTPAQRICINQERGFLMQDLIPDYSYDQSPAINEKVNFILQQIRNNNLSTALMAQVRTLMN